MVQLKTLNHISIHLHLCSAIQHHDSHGHIMSCNSHSGAKKKQQKPKKTTQLRAALELLIFHRVKPSSTAVMMFHWPVQAAQQQTRRLTESWWGPSGELNVSCCAKLQKNNSSSSCPQRKTEGSGKQRQPCQQGPQCLIIMLSTRDGRFTTCPLIVCALGYSRCGRLTRRLRFCFRVRVNLCGFAVASLISQQSTLAPAQRQSEICPFCLSEFIFQ